MPGHIKKSDGPDPDPSPWLIVSPELKEKLKSKPYDAKKSCWVPEKATGGYLEGLIESTDGEKVTVQILETKEVIQFLLKRANAANKVVIYFLEKGLQKGSGGSSESSQV